MKITNIYIIAGPNGSGKTTFAKEFLPDYVKCPHFVNADLIAQGLSPFSPQIAAMKAGRLVLEQLHELAKKNLDFAFETTLAGKTYVNYLKEMKRRGYCIHLFSCGFQARNWRSNALKTGLRKAATMSLQRM